MQTTYVEEKKAMLNGFEIPIECINMIIRKSKDITHDKTCLHYHDYIELLYGLDCDATVLCGASEIKLTSGDLVIIKSKVPHNVMSNSEISTYSVIKFMPQILYAAEQPVIEFKYIIPFITSEGGGCRLFKRAELSNTQIPETIEKMMTEWNSKSYGFEIALRMYAVQIALWFVRSCRKDGDESENITPEAAKAIQNAVEYAHSNYQTAASSLAAKHCGLSSSYFSRVFKKIMKRNFADYVNYLRITEAQRLLADTDKSITEIALDVGFSTTSYFIQCFKKQLKITPKQFRKYYENAPKN